MTPEERRLWWYLRDRFPDVRWRRQEPVGPYIADFVCYAARLAVEVDGGQHVDSDWDEQRDAFIRCRGFEVLRFDNAAVLTRIEDVLDDIGDTMRSRVQDRPPQSG